MTTLFGPNGQPISSKQFKKAQPPALGEKHGQWGGENAKFLQMPGGGFLQFNLDNLDLGDFRQMKDHYQINSSLAILTFMMHQMEWHVDCEDKKIAAECEEQLRGIWSRLVRAKSQANWAGYSPNVLQWDNDVRGRRIVLDKVKDLIPEDCKVHWKTADPTTSPDPGRISSKIAIYDGIDQMGWSKTIPRENSYWYPLLMENGNYYGRKLLRPAFQPWFFSTLMHLFANRYYERFGEPTPVGRAPFDEEVEYNGQTMKGNQMMGHILNALRNRSVVVLPNDKTPGQASETSPDFDYQIEYLESQMRGADFGQYMTRLDEEMSLGLFTPILMMRTADVGSYNLGVGHTQVYLWMLNAISGDWAYYIEKYILQPIARFNFTENAPPVRMKFRRMGKGNEELIRDILAQGYRDGRFKFDTTELGEAAGLTLTEIQQVTEEPDPNANPDDQPTDENGKPTSKANGGQDKEVKTTVKKIAARIAPQVRKCFERGEMPDPSKIAFGHEGALRQAFAAESPLGFMGQTTWARTVNAWMKDAAGMPEEFPTHARYMDAIESVMNYEAERLTNG